MPGAPIRSLEEINVSPSKRKRKNASSGVGDGEDDDDFEKRPPRHPKEVVRTDAREQKLDKFLAPGEVSISA